MRNSGRRSKRAGKQANRATIERARALRQRRPGRPAYPTGGCERSRHNHPRARRPRLKHPRTTKAHDRARRPRRTRAGRGRVPAATTIAVNAASAVAAALPAQVAYPSWRPSNCIVNKSRPRRSVGARARPVRKRDCERDAAGDDQTPATCCVSGGRRNMRKQNAMETWNGCKRCGG